MTTDVLLNILGSYAFPMKKVEVVKITQEEVDEKNTKHSIHLLTEAIAKKVLSEGTTAAAALESPEFLRFALKRIDQESILANL